MGDNMPGGEAPRPQGRLGRAAAAVGRAVDRSATSASRLAQAGLSWLLWPVLAAIAGGSTFWFALDRAKRLPWLETNKVPHVSQLWALASVVGALGVVLLLTLVIAVATGVVRKHWSFVGAVRRAGAWAAFALVAPPILALSKKGIEKAPKFTLMLCAAAALAAGIAAYRVTRPAPLLDGQSDADRDGVRRVPQIAADVGAWLIVLGMGVAYAWFFSDLSITNHHALVTRTTDLGYYDNIFWQSIHGRPLGCSFIKAGYHGSAHFDPILVLLSPAYLLYPRAEFLLVLQSIWCALGVIPAYLIGKAQLGTRAAGLVLGFCYLAHPALHGANMYEFHSLTLATVPLLFALHFFQIRAWKRYGFTVAIALLVREDVALMMLGVGLWGLLHQDRAPRRAGLLTIAGSVVWFGIVKAFFMTSPGLLMSGKEAYSFAYYYEHLIPNKKGTGGLILSLVTNPIFVLEHVLTEEKILFVVTLFLPLALLPLLVKRERILLLYGMLFTLLASRSAVYSTHFQYTAAILPFAFAITPVAIQRIASHAGAVALGFDGRKLRAGLLAAILVGSGAVSWKFGGVIENETFKGGFYRVDRSLSEEQRATHKWVREMVALIPPKASVGVSNKLGPHVSGRRHAYFYGQKRPEYIFVDEKELKSDRAKSHKKAIAEGRLEELGRRGTLALFKAKNADPALRDSEIGEGEMGDVDVDLEERGNDGGG